MTDATLPTVAVPGTVTDQIKEDVWRLLVPTSRAVHDYLSIIVERVEGGWVLSDAGEVSSIRGVDVDRAVQLLRCAGAEVGTSDHLVTLTVAEEDPLEAGILTFAYYLVGAQLLWNARECLAEEGGDVGPAEESPTKRLARKTRERLVASVPAPAAPLIQLDRPVHARGERVRAPLAIAPPAPASIPLLIAAFIDTGASEGSVSAAKRTATWTFEVVHELAIPKYLVVSGSDEAVDHFASFYDNLNIAAVSANDGEQLVQDARDAVARLGYG